MYRFGSYLLVMSLCLAMLGCSGSDDLSVTKGPSANSTPSNTTAHTSSIDDKLYEPILLPFDAPPLEEIEAKVTWVDQRVVDSIELLREKLSESEPLTDVKTALSLRNDFPKSKVNNEKIISTLGRLPESDQQVNYEAMITRHIGADIKSTNPFMASSTGEQDLLSLIGLGLFSFDWNMLPFADADYVKSWQTSDDMMYDKVVIRDDLYWDDGTQVTAHDVVFSFQTILNPQIPIPAVRQGTDEIRWIEAYDEFTLVFFHKEPSPVSVLNLNFPIIPKHAYENTIDDDYTMRLSEAHKALLKDPIEGGPYRLVKQVRNQEVVLERREEFYMVNGKQVRAKPYFKTIRLRVIENSDTAMTALISGEIDEMIISAEHWEGRANNEDFYKQNTKATAIEWTTFNFTWNCKIPFFSDKRVRRAMGLAFDHEEMLKNIFKDLYIPSNGIYHPDSWMSPKNPPPYLSQDLDKAEELLDEAGWDDSDGDGIRDKIIGGRKVDFEFTVVTSPRPNRKKVCVLLQESLDKIGIKCNVKILEFTALQQATRDGDFQAYMGGWGTGVDPFYGENIFGTKAERNFGKYSNPEVDKLYKQGMKEFDREKRAAIYAQIHEKLYEDQPLTWLYCQSAFYGFNKKLRGYNFSPRGPYSYGPGFSSIWSPEAQ